MGKGLLFSLAAACMLFASIETRAQGQNCETATPWSGMAMIMAPATFPTDAWYSLSVAEDSHMSFGFSAYTGKIQIFKGCGGEEILPISTSPEFILEKGNYIIKVGTIGITEFIGITGTLTALSNAPEALLSKLPEGSCCVKPILTNLADFSTNIKANTPTWYKLTMPSSMPVKAGENPFMPSGIVYKITSFSVKNTDCNATANEGNVLMPELVYMKKGENLIKVSVDADIQIQFSAQGAMVTTCESGASRIPSLALDAKTTFANYVFDYYWTFTAAEAGTYKITTKAPMETILSAGKYVESDEGKFSCDFENAPSVTVNSEEPATLDVTLAKNDRIVIYNDVYNRFTDNTAPYIKIEKTAANNIAPKTNVSKDIEIAPNPSNGKFTVKSYLLSEGASVNIYDMAGNAIYRATANTSNGELPVQLNNAQPGTYLVLVIGKSKSASTKITIE